MNIHEALLMVNELKKKNVPRTPPEMSKQVLLLCDHLSPNIRPFFVDVRVEPNAEPKKCFNNVECKISSSGGHYQHGWRIFEFPDLYLDAEFHAVWVSPEEKYIDISPNEANVNTILFLPDLVRTDIDMPLDNVVLPLTKNEGFLTLLKEDAHSSHYQLLL
jgi:hypothetical protein